MTKRTRPVQMHGIPHRFARPVLRGSVSTHFQTLAAMDVLGHGGHWCATVISRKAYPMAASARCFFAARLLEFLAAVIGLARLRLKPPSLVRRGECSHRPMLPLCPALVRVHLHYEHTCIRDADPPTAKIDSNVTLSDRQGPSRS